MSIVVLPRNAAKVVLVGRLDAAGASKIELLFGAEAGSRSHLLIDMSSVTFLASVGIRTLVMAAKRLHSRGGQLWLLCPRPEVEHVLQTVGLTELLPVVRDEAQALDALQP